MSNSISIIIPVYNEKESLEELYGEIRNATGSFSKREILFIDDGSTDGSTELLKTMAEEYADVILIQFYRNYGKAAALSEGFNHSTGDYIVTMDADLQDDPLEINNLFEKYLFIWEPEEYFLKNSETILQLFSISLNINNI